MRMTGLRRLADAVATLVIGQAEIAELVATESRRRVSDVTVWTGSWTMPVIPLNVESAVARDGE